ncbi:MAG TPA: ATP-dependent helicase [Patescibacteria group bacterium]|nr:ATP-dependent helicase [Patescibacteria group bacterium]
MKEAIDYEKELNPGQLSAVQATEGPYLVIAGAGSGKTRVLVYRVAYLVERGVNPGQILLLTFTRKAAQEMLRRASLLLDNRCQHVAGGTFHSFAHMTLRKYAYLVGLAPHFTILDQSDAEDTVNLIRTQLGFHKAEKRFPRKQALLEVISKCVNKSDDLETVLYEEYPQFIQWVQEIEKIRQEYAAYKQVKALVDYDDLLVYLKTLLSRHPDVRLKLCQKYRYIMVDEYQDTNKLQGLIACLLASEHKNIMVVGDDAQSIYSFRGANFKNIIDFPKIFSDAKIITLEENYRSTQPILNLANEVIRFAGEKFEKNLYTKKGGLRLPVYVDAADEHAQSRYVADKILQLREEGIELNNIAVLFRSGWHSNDLEIELASRNIPFVKYGGQKFIEAAHIKDVISYLRIAYNAVDEVSWYRVLLLMRGIGPKTAERIIGSILAQQKNAPIDNRLIQKHPELAQLLELLKEADAQGQGPAELIRLFLRSYEPLLKEKYDDFDKRLNDLDSLIRIAGRYDSLQEFLSDIALEPPERSVVESGTQDKDDSSLTLSTIHSAKGLEWHTVFVIYLAEGHLPSYLSLEQEESIEEERRLFYVAATRAKENLFLLKPHIDRSSRSYFGEAGSVFTQASRFLEEGDILKRFVEIESSPGQDAGFDVDSDGVLPPLAGRDEKLWEMMKEYFRNEDWS